MIKTLGSHVRNNLAGYVALFVALGGTTYAATGGNFILGQPNSASSTTALSAPVAGNKALLLTNTNTGAGATALGLNVASGHAPFTVNSGTKVTNLNADMLDGLNSTAFLSSSRVRRIHWRVEPDPRLTGDSAEILTYGPLHLKGFCRNGYFGDPPHGDVTLIVRSDGAATANWFFVHDGGQVKGANGLALPAGSAEVPIEDVESGHSEGTLIYDWNGGTISVALHAFHTYTGFPGSLCEIYGTALHAP
jgi:hypothetical protein